MAHLVSICKSSQFIMQWYLCVGAEPPQMEGVATSGVALQEPGSVQGSSGSVHGSSRVATSGVALRVQEPCASTSSGVQRL